MAILTLTWNTHRDDRVCPICLPLDGHLWAFDTDRDAFPEVLEAGGIVVWDTAVDQPRSHGHHAFNCRCWLTSTWDFSQDTEKLLEIKMLLQSRLNELRERRSR